MIQVLQKVLLSSLTLIIAVLPARSKNGRFRVMWRNNPATSMVIGWDQYTGNSPVLYYDTKKHGQNPAAYAFSQKPDAIKKAKGMTNNFVRLENLSPNTTYYFVIKDSEGVSACLSFKTAPDDPNTRLSIIAGGDSRNNREARQLANKLVAKLRPHFVMFAGDMTNNDDAREWKMWLDDWQLTIAKDGRLFPIVTALGNHEYSPQTLIDVFDIPAENAYYGLSFGGNLLRVYTLNSKVPTGGQLQWLEENLADDSRKFHWKFAQYHHSISPHTKQKDPREDLRVWANLFHKYEVQLALESDAHVVKWTYPIRPFRGKGSVDGFVRDDETGTVYIGEGCWGAPLRDNNNNRPWTRASGKFNQFKWVFIDKNKIEVRTVMTDGSNQVQAVSPSNIFVEPRGLSLWRPSTGEVVVLKNSSRLQMRTPPPPPPFAKGTPPKFQNVKAIPKSGAIQVSWVLPNLIPTSKFIIERKSERDSDFKLLGTLTPPKPAPLYEYIDKNPPEGRVQYRIKCIPPKYKPFMTDTECQFKKADVVERLPKIANDPNTGLLIFDYNLKKTTEVSFVIMDPVNRAAIKIFPGVVKPTGRQISKLDVRDVPKGNYTLIVKSKEGLIKKYQAILK